jgi:hypothetical protein
MYGEKTEENDELKMDLQDVKEMYKLQVNKKFLENYIWWISQRIK